MKQATDTRYRNLGNHTTGYNLYNESHADFFWDAGMNRKPEPVAIVDFIHQNQYNTSAAVADHYYKRYMDDVDYLARVNTYVTVDIGYSIDVELLVPDGRVAPDFTYTAVAHTGPDGYPTAAEYTAWYDSMVAAWDVKPEMIVFITNGFVSTLGWTVFNNTVQADKRFINFNVTRIPYTFPGTQYWIEDIARTMETVKGIASMDFSLACNARMS